MRKRKIAAMLVSLCMALSLLPFCAFADDMAEADVAEDNAATENLEEDAGENTTNSEAIGENNSLLAMSEKDIGEEENIIPAALYLPAVTMDSATVSEGTVSLSGQAVPDVCAAALMAEDMSWAKVTCFENGGNALTYDAATGTLSGLTAMDEDGYYTVDCTWDLSYIYATLSLRIPQGEEAVEPDAKEEDKTETGETTPSADATETNDAGSTAAETASVAYAASPKTGESSIALVLGILCLMGAGGCAIELARKKN